MSERYQSFAEFWPFYVSAHAHPWTQRIHCAGTLGAIACAAGFLCTGQAPFLFAGLLVGYAPAWLAHFFIEHNKPATWSYPLWSLVGDLKMLSLVLRGRPLQEEV
jgi:hypothetical protein